MSGTLAFYFQQILLQLISSTYSYCDFHFDMFFADFYCNNRQYILPVPFFFSTLS